MPFRLQLEDTHGAVIHRVEFVEGELVIGRAEDCDLPVQSGSVSRHHARVFVHLGRPYVEDLRSSNGVVVDGERIRGMHALTAGTVAIIGDHILRFDADPIPIQERLASGPHASAAADVPSLVRLDDGFDGPRVLPLMATTSRIGRASTADLQIVDGSVSRIHAEVRVSASSAIVSDLASANGTFVNGQPIHHPTALNEGAVLQVGDVPLLFTATPASVRWSEVVVPSPGVPPTRPTLLLTVAAAVAATVIVGAALALMLMREGEGVEDSTPLERATQAANSGDWETAAEEFSAALQADPTNESLTAASAHARREASARRRLAECREQLESARSLQFAEDTVAAVDAFETAQSCFRSIDATTSAHPEAQTALQQSIVPPLVELLRLNGLQALESGEYDVALEHLRNARRLHAERTEPAQGESASAEELGAELRTAYVRAGVAAAESENWSRAVSMLTQANELAPLDGPQAQQLADARSRAARAR